MTIKEIMNVTGLSDKTIREKIKSFYPELIKNGKPTILTEEQALKVVEDLRKKGFISPRQNSELPRQNSEGFTKQDMKDFAQVIVQETLKGLTQLTKKQEYLPGVSLKNKIEMLIHKHCRKTNASEKLIYNTFYSVVRQDTGIDLNIANIESLSGTHFEQKVIDIAEELFQ